MNEILVSIWCLTYNHKDYIRDTIEGFLSQRTNFLYEIIIHDDASNDGTVEIIKEYEQKYPDLIRGIYQKENQYGKNPHKVKWVYELEVQNCKGKYIAFCEGDDFWIDKHKLQIQIEWMENNSEYSMTAHNAISWNYINKTLKAIDVYENDKEILPEEIIIQHQNFPTSSLIIRLETIKIDDFFWETGVGDWTTQLFYITRGKTYYFDRIMSVYRCLHVGAWSMMMKNDSIQYFEHCIRMIEFLEKYNKYTNYQYDKYIITMIQRYAFMIMDTDDEAERNNFFSNCERRNKESDFEFNVYIKELKHIFLQLFDENYYDNRLEEFINKYRYVVIFGAGDYASRLVLQLKNHHIKFEGFAVSNRNSVNKEYMKKPIWKLDEIPFDKDQMGIIVAIKPVIWYELVDVLEQNKIKNYICPFLYKKDL